MRPEAKREAAVRASKEMMRIASYEKAIDTEGNAVAEYDKDVEMEDVEEGFGGKIQTDDGIGAFAAQVQVQVGVVARS